MRTELMSVGRRLANGGLELVGRESPGLEPVRSSTTAETVIAATGAGRVLVDVLDGEPATARFVRDLVPPHRIDIERFEAAQAAFRRAGIDDLISEPAAQVVGAVFAQLDSSLPDPYVRLPWDPRDYLKRIFLERADQRDEVFPMMWWDDDPSVGIDELAGLLERKGLAIQLPRQSLLATADRDLDQLNAEVARNKLCIQLCAVANPLLAGLTDRRFCGPYVSTHGAGEPEWLFTTPSQYESLLSEALLVAWDPARWSPMEVVVQSRPPDRGEIDFSKFPTGDDPF